jgi:hypothetical protein
MAQSPAIWNDSGSWEGLRNGAWPMALSSPDGSSVLLRDLHHPTPVHRVCSNRWLGGLRCLLVLLSKTLALTPSRETLAWLPGRRPLPVNQAPVLSLPCRVITLAVQRHPGRL